MVKSKGIQSTAFVYTILDTLSFFKSKFCPTREIQEVSGNEAHEKAVYLS